MKRKNYWKKLLVSMTLVMSMVLGVAGCGNGEESKGGKGGGGQEVFGGYVTTTDDITLTFWHLEDETTIDYLAEAFTVSLHS